LIILISAAEINKRTAGIAAGGRRVRAGSRKLQDHRLDEVCAAAAEIAAAVSRR
jgi:hypothetical protein